MTSTLMGVGGLEICHVCRFYCFYTESSRGITQYLRVFCGSPEKHHLKSILWESWEAPPKGYSVTGFPLNKPYKELGKTFQAALFSIDGFLLYFLRNSSIPIRWYTNTYSCPRDSLYRIIKHFSQKN